MSRLKYPNKKLGKPKKHFDDTFKLSDAIKRFLGKAEKQVDAGLLPDNDFDADLIDTKPRAYYNAYTGLVEYY